MDACMLSESAGIFFRCERIGSMHRKIASYNAGLFGTVVNVFDKTINIKTNEEKLLLISLGTVHSPLTINVTPLTNLSSNDFSFKSFSDFVQNRDQLLVINKPKPNNQGEEEVSTTTTHLKIGRCFILINKPVQFFQNNIVRPQIHQLDKFIDNRKLVFSVLTSCALSQKAGSLLNPDKTTEGLLEEFLSSIQENHLTMDIRSPMFRERISRCLLRLCGRGPGFTPAGDDFVGGFLAIVNWIRTSLKIGPPIVPGAECRKLTSWTSFRLMESNACGLVDTEIQELINSIARGTVLRYVDSIRLIARRGHTSGIDFATGATVGLYLAIDSLKG
jgi:Protein of unknown function (DUF2877)